MVAGVGEAGAEATRREGDEAVLRVDECICAVAAVALPCETQQSLGFGEVVDARVVAPAVGSKDERSDHIQLAVAGRPLSVVRAVGLTTPGVVTCHRPLVHEHVALGPTQQAVEDVLAVHLHGDHHAVGHALCAHVVVLQVGDVAQRVAHFEVDTVGTEEHFLEDVVDTAVDVFRGIAHLSEIVAVVPGLHAALGVGWKRFAFE